MTIKVGYHASHEQLSPRTLLTLVQGNIEQTMKWRPEAARTIFTTHTPVPAGMDRFPRFLMEKYFKGWADECGVPFDRAACTKSASSCATTTWRCMIDRFPR